MNKPILRALYLDAYYQVLDNRVFRILALLVCPIVLLTFVIGFRPEGIVLFWGMKTITYPEFAGWFGQHLAPETQDVNLAFIQNVQHLIVGQLAGNVGILFSLAATAFFVPRMLEKGAADVVFSRPVGRATLLLARYFAGVLFVLMLGSVLVFGMHIGFLLVSGASDPAFLWSILTLTYVFALVHAVSTVAAVFSRSSVAAILTSVLFFSVNGCVHNAWIPIEWARARMALTRAESDEGDAAPRLDLDQGAAGVFTGAIDVLHFTLPKTSDADMIVAKLRTLVSGEKVVLHDAQGALIVHAPLAPFEFSGPRGEADLAQAPARWTWKGSEGSSGTLSLRRESRLVEKPGGKPRKRSSSEYARDWMASLKNQPGAEAPERSKVEEERIDLEYVAWSEPDQTRKLVHARSWFGSGDWAYVLELEGEAPGTPGEFARDRFRELSRSFLIDRDDPRTLDPPAWYMRQLDWTAPLRHNIFFSVGSSVLFAVLLLWLAAWKLRRIDF